MLIVVVELIKQAPMAVIFFAYKVLIVHTLLFNKFSAGVSPLLFYKEMLIVVVELSKPITHTKIRKKEE